MHLRPPAFGHGIASLIWAIALGAFIWIGGIAIGLSSAMGFVIGAVAGFGIFLFVRIYGEEEPRRPLSRD